MDFLIREQTSKIAICASVDALMQSGCLTMTDAVTLLARFYFFRFFITNVRLKSRGYP